MAIGDKPHSSKRAETKQSHDEEAKPLDLEERRQHLKAQLVQKNAFKKPDSDEEQQGNGNETAKGIAQAMKLSTEFLAGIVVGVVLGLGFDQLIGTSPWGLIVFLFLGFAAGVLNILRSTGRVAPSQIGKRGIENPVAADENHHVDDKGSSYQKRK